MERQLYYVLEPAHPVYDNREKQYFWESNGTGTYDKEWFSSIEQAKEYALLCDIQYGEGLLVVELDWNDSQYYDWVDVISYEDITMCKLC